MIQEEKDVVVDNEVVKKEDTSKAKIKEETKDQKVEKKEKNEQKESNIDDLYESMSSITGLDGESFHSFIPSAQIHEEDRKTIEKVRDAGYKIPKYNIIEEYKQLQLFNDDEADEFDQNTKITKYAQIFMRKSQYTPAQAAGIFQCRYRMKLNREMKRRKELMKSSTIGFFIRKYFCKFRAKSSVQQDNNHFYVKFSVKVYYILYKTLIIIILL